MILDSFFERVAAIVTWLAGSTLATVLAFSSVFVWTIGGFIFGFSDSYQLIINTGTTIVTFLMVFLIQRTQNKDSVALQMKLNELIASHERASNRLLNVEELTEAEIARLRRRYRLLAGRCKEDDSLTTAHSIEEIEDDD